MSKGFFKTYLRLALPAIIAQLVVFVVDNLNVAILGSLSEKAISGYTIANQSYDIYVMLALGLSGGFHVYISQLYGSPDRKKCSQVLQLGLTACTVVGLIYSLIMFFMAEPFIRIFIQDAERVMYGVRYLRIFTFSLMLYGVNLMLSGAYTIVGKAIVSMYSGIINCVVSLVCSYTLVYGKFGIPAMDVEGAALAILIGRLAEFVFLLVKMLNKDSEFKLFSTGEKLESDVLLRVLKTAGPLVINETCYAFAFFMIVRNLSHLDEQYISCYTVTNNCNKLFFVISYGLSPAVGRLIGRNLGLGRFEDAKRGGDDILWMNFYVHVVFGVLLALLSGSIPGFFSLEGDVAAVCTKMLISKALLGLFAGYGNCFYNIFRIGGNSKQIFFVDGLFSIVCPMAVSFIVCFVFPLPFFWAYVCIDAMNIVKTAICYSLYRKGIWLNQLA
ncbi:MAG: MATE family efflux transporter [Erysipelotrichaceae bacterium]|nr:MATE family efflux transporter [Erysipelotrichaceae bacterium]